MAESTPSSRGGTETLRLSEAAKAALALASSEVSAGEPLQTAGVLSALARVDVRGDWERLWLLTGAWGFLDAARSYRDPPTTESRPTAHHRGFPLSPATELALRRLTAMASAFDTEPASAGALALVLVADPDSGAARGLLAPGEITHDGLLELVQSELLDVRLDGFDDFLADTREQQHTIPEDESPEDPSDDAAPDRLMRLLLQFSAIPQLRHARQLLEDNEELLLSPAADAAMEMQLSIGRAAGHDEMVTAIESRRQLLRRCREIGIPDAFVEAAAGVDKEVEVSDEAVEMAAILLEFVTARSWPASKRVLLEHQDKLLSEQADMALGVFIEGAETAGDNAAEMLRRHRELLRRCRAIGVDAAFGELDAPSPADDSPSPIELVREFVTVPTTHEAARLIRRHPDLATSLAVEQLEALIEFATKDRDTGAAQGLRERRDLLRRCVDLGIDAALDELHGRPDPDELLSLLTRALESGPEAGVAATLKAHPELLDAADDVAVDQLINTARSHGNEALATRLEQVKEFVAKSRSLRGLTSGGMRPEQLRALPVVYEFFRTDSWAAARQVVEDHPELLDPLADQVLEILVQAAERRRDAAAVASFTTHRRILQRARESGVATAFSEIDGTGDDSSAPDSAMRQVRVSVLGQAATMFMDRFRENEAIDDIDAAIECWRDIVATADPDAHEYPHHVNYLGTALTARYGATHQLADLREALEVHRKVLATSTRDHTDRPGWTTDLGNVLADMHAHTGEEHFLDEAVIVYESAAKAGDTDADNRTGLLANLADGLCKRFDLRKLPHDLDDAITAMRAAIDAADTDDPLLADITSNLALALIERSDRNRADLDDAIAIYERTIPRLREDDDRWVYLRGYGDALRRRADRDDRHSDLDLAAASFRRAAAAAPDALRFADSLGRLGDVLRSRFAMSADVADLDAAIRALEEAVAAVPPAHPDLAVLTSKLALALTERYDTSGSTTDLDAAIAHQERAVTLSLSGSADRAGNASSLGNRYLERSSITHDTEDLDAAVSWHELAVRATPPESSELPGYLSNWGNSLRARYERNGDTDALAQAVNAYARAVSLTPETSGRMPGQLVGWAAAMRARFEHTGDIADLDRAVDAFRRAVGAKPEDRHVRNLARAGLANGLRVRFANTHEGDGLDVAITLHESVLDDTPAGSPERPDRLSNLANAVDDRYDQSDDPADLERAIVLYRTALRESKPGWTHRRSVEVSLADSLLKQSDAEHGYDVTEAIRLCENAIASVSEQSFELPRCLMTLANGLRRRGHPGDDDAATEHYRRCCQLALRTSPRSVLAAANVWGSWAAERAQWAEAADAYRSGMKALRLLLGRQTTRADKEEYLRGTQRIAVGLAHARTMLGKLKGAVVALERGRAVLLAEQLGPESQRGQQAPTFRSITPYAQAAPIAYLAAAQVGGIGLIVGRDATVTAVNLPGLSAAALRERMLPYAEAYRDWLAGGDTRAWDAELDDIGRWLWTTVMGPVLDALPAGTPELVLVPGGFLGLLPLHAAGTEDPTTRTGRRYVLDDIRITYAANARARGAALQIADTPADSLLVVEEPLPVNANTIANAEQEAGRIRRAFSRSRPLRTDTEPIEHLRNNAATHEAVLSALTRHAVLHLCCHGFAQIVDPLRGGLLLADDKVLSVAELMRRRPTPARLAVLSACETAMVGGRLPDEVVGLPSAMAEAGFAGVVGSLWAVPSGGMAQLAARFYELWRADGLEPAEALRQAQREVRDVSRRPRPSAWAAMTYTGA